MKKGMSHHDKLNNLKRIEGQVRGIQKMIEEGRYCVDILNAVGAAIGALRGLEASILKDHLNACVQNAFIGKSESARREKLEEIYKLIGNLRK